MLNFLNSSTLTQGISSLTTAMSVSYKLLAAYCYCCYRVLVLKRVPRTSTAAPDPPSGGPLNRRGLTSGYRTYWLLFSIAEGSHLVTLPDLRTERELLNYPPFMPSPVTSLTATVTAQKEESHNSRSKMDWYRSYWNLRLVCSRSHWNQNNKSTKESNQSIRDREESSSRFNLL